MLEGATVKIWQPSTFLCTWTGLQENAEALRNYSIGQEANSFFFVREIPTWDLLYIDLGQKRPIGWKDQDAQEEDELGFSKI
jgi:hypothetical protein